MRREVGQFQEKELEGAYGELVALRKEHDRVCLEAGQKER